MLVRTCGATLQGVEGISVRVEVDSGRGLPAFHIVGRGDRVVGEGRDRIRAAFRQAGLEFPPGRVTVNLAPTDVPKSGSGLDLAVAVGIAATRLSLCSTRLERTLFVGELGLDGAVRGVAGTLALVSTAGGGIEQAVVPAECLQEAAVCPRLPSLGASHLAAAIEWLRGVAELPVGQPGSGAADRTSRPDLSEVRGQEQARRVLEIAAAGSHNLALVGPPGSGKTLLARRLPGLLPDLDFEAALEVTRIHGVAGASPRGGGLIVRPPLRAPHHSISSAGMLGGGQPLRPGEISLAHRGVLFLDELPEFRRGTLEGLRQPLEEGEIRLVRAQGALRLPARFQWVVAQNPCPCGHRGDPLRECRCDEALLRRYRARLSGPLLDRIDLRVEVPRVEWRDLAEGRTGEPSRGVRGRVEAARRFALARRRTRAGPGSGQGEGPLDLLRSLDPTARGLVERAVDRLGLSLRGVARAMRVARTIADLDASSGVGRQHVAEALAYRQA